MRLAAILLAAALAASGAVLPASAADAGDPGILVYNAQHEALAKSWVAAFTKQTGIKVTLRNGEDMELANQIIQEGAASPADVFLTENSPAMVLVDSHGLLAPLAADTLTEVAPRFRPASGDWVGIAARTTVLAYNKDKLTPADLPKSIMDLAAPKWQGRWGAAPAGADFQAIVSAVLAIEGEDASAKWLKGVAANAVKFRSNGAAMRAVNMGQIEAAVIYHYYYFGDQARTGENSKNVALAYFGHGDPGAFVSTSGGGVLKTSKHRAEAEAFLKWIAGPEGQTILKTGTSFEYAVGVGAQSNPALVPLSQLQPPDLDPSALNSQKARDLMLAAGLL